MMRIRSALCLLLVLSGCATKRDIRDLQLEVDSLRIAQREMLDEIRRQNASVIESLDDQGTQLRGDLNNRLTEIERQLVQVQELTGQGQAEVARLRQQIRQRESAAPSVVVPADAPEPEELFNASVEMLQRGSLTTARSGFEEFLRFFSRHPLAPDAQFYVAESYAEGGDPAAAVEAYGRVLELYPASERAPTSLYRAALLVSESGDPDRARDLLNRLVSAYPNSPEAPLAREQLERM